MFIEDLMINDVFHSVYEMFHSNLISYRIAYGTFDSHGYPLSCYERISRNEKCVNWA